MVKETESQEVCSATVKVHGPGSPWVVIDSVPNVLPHRDTEKMSIKRLYLLGDRHYVNKVKFLL